MKHLSDKEKEILAEINSGIFHGISTKENIRELLATINSLREEREALVKTHDDNITICKALQDVCKQVEPEMTKLMLERDLLLMENECLRSWTRCFKGHFFKEADALKAQREGLK